MTTFRYLVGGCGIAVMVFGGSLLVELPDAWRVGVWLVAGVLVHDGLIAPLVYAFAALATAVGRRPRGVTRAALIVAGSLTLIAVPPLLRPGGVANATVLPLDYPRNWLLAMATVAVIAAGWAGVRECLRRAARRRRARGDVELR